MTKRNEQKRMRNWRRCATGFRDPDTAFPGGHSQARLEHNLGETIMKNRRAPEFIRCPACSGGLETSPNYWPESAQEQMPKPLPSSTKTLQSSAKSAASAVLR